MTTTNETTAEPVFPAESTMPGGLTLLFAISVGVIVTNLYTPQTLIGLIGPSLGVLPAADGLITTAALVAMLSGSS